MNRFAKTPLTLVATIVGAFIGYLAVQKAFDHFRAPAELLDWRRQQLAGLTMEAPGDFKATPVDFGPAKEFIESSEMQENKSRGFEIAVVRSVYKTGIELSLDGAVQGAVGGIARLDGARDLQHTATDLTIAGKLARRLSVTAARWRKNVCVEALLIADGQTFYQVQVVFEADNSRGALDADRVLKSVLLGP